MQDGLTADELRSCECGESGTVFGFLSRMMGPFAAVAKRNRQRAKLAAPSAEYRDDEGDVLVLRGSLTPGSRAQYAETLSGGLDREDALQRAAELLFERLAVSWTIAGLEITKQKELLGRYRMASPEERRFICQAIRSHVTEHFPELKAP